VRSRLRSEHRQASHRPSVSSSGSCSSLWLAFLPPGRSKSDYPVARESTRLWCAAGCIRRRRSTRINDRVDANILYAPTHSGFKGDPVKKRNPFDDFLGRTDPILPLIAEYSAVCLGHRRRSPIYLSYETPPAFVGEPGESSPLGETTAWAGGENSGAWVGSRTGVPGATGLKARALGSILFEKLKAPT